MAKRLISLKIDHVAGVDKPANRRKFLIIKSESIGKQMSVKKEGDKFCVYDGDKKMGEYDSMEAARSAMMRMNKEQGVTMLTKEQIVKIGDASIQEAVIKQMEEMQTLQKQVEDKDAEIAKMKEKPPDLDQEEFWKGTPPHIRNAFERLQNENEATRKAAEKERGERDEMLWTQKGEAFKYLQVTPQMYGRVMKKIAREFPSEAKEIEKILSLADEAISKGSLFAEIGKNGFNGGTGIDANDIIVRVEALADEYAKRDDKLSKADAIQKVFREHSDWYPLYRQAAQHKVG